VASDEADQEINRQRDRNHQFDDLMCGPKEQLALAAALVQ